MRASSCWGLGLVLLASAGCNVGLGSSSTSPPASTQAPARIVELRATGVTATAVGEKLAVLVDGLDERGRTAWAFEYELGAATCDLPGCTAIVAGYRVIVASSVPGVAHVTVATMGDPGVNVSFEVPFRVATKLVVTRALDESPAGSAFAMVPGDEQTWYVTPGDSEGPLAASTNAIGRTNLHAAGDAPTCGDERYPSDDRAYASSRLRCTFGSATPTSLELSFSYGAIVRTEKVRVVPLLPVREASLLVCRVTKREADDWTGSSSVPTAVDDVMLPCEPTTRIVYGPGSCDGVRERILVPRLVLEDGTIALGGAQYLWPGEPPSATNRGTMRMPSGKGTIVARFGAGIISVPYDIDPSCGW